ncbi:phage tail protein [Bosea sp. MMO-172]|uniref:phage tail protein n=1 Tax=Bosea sp. MMO-172 TaxID=3127885 RepID=UPI0030165934
MADLSYFHGVNLDESPDTPSVLRLKNHGVTFLNGHADDADPAAFPINRPTLVTSLKQGVALGAAGSLLRDLRTILEEGGSYVVVNRVEYSATPATLAANLIGDPVERTGLYAFHRVKALTGYQPRVIVTEGDTGSWIADGVVSVALSGNGLNLTEAPVVTATGGGSAAGKVLPTLEAVMGTGSAAGTVASVRVLTPGKGMTVAPTIAFSGGGSDAGKVLPAGVTNLGDVGNAFVSALRTICHADGARARAYIHGPNTTNSDAVRFRNTINSDRILVIDPLGIKNVDDVPVIVPSAPVFAGVRSRVVASAEGVSGSVSNKMIRTLDGAARTINYPLDSNYLNEHQVNTIINERGGLRTWGSRLAAENILWQFDSVRATADMVNEALEDLYFLYVDRKFTRGNLKMMVEDGNAALRVFTLSEDILGGRVWLSDLNVPSLNAQGKVFLNVEFEPVGLMEQIHVTTHRNILYYQLLLDSVRGAIETGPLSLAA